MGADWTIVLVILGGAALALQAGTNGTLGRLGGNGLFSAFWSFVSGIVPLAIYWLASTHGGKDTQFKELYHDAPWWCHFGGLMGASYVLMIVILAPRLGAGNIISTATTSQMITALIFDNYGALDLEVRKATAGRIIGIVLSAFGVALVMGLEKTLWIRFRGRKTGTVKGDVMAKSSSEKDVEAGLDPSFRETDSHTQSVPSQEGSPAKAAATFNTGVDAPSSPPTTKHTAVPATESTGGFDWTILFAIAGGVALALQASMNGELGIVGGGGYAATWSFASGGVVLGLCLCVDLYCGPACRESPRWTFMGCWRRTPAWSWTGGLLGAAYVLAITVIIPRLGAATVLGTSVCAQVVTAVVCDHFGWVGLTKLRVGWGRLVGVAAIIGGVVMITVL
ncbi:hypothetical protein HKX48_003982 [Thoreauomyces humboldtii]|nr:hypothetical protein HKX48_003982 [Thoreauomyces humboldtii]